jgi:putative heme-binding domain-containing protein
MHALQNSPRLGSYLSFSTSLLLLPAVFLPSSAVAQRNLKDIPSTKIDDELASFVVADGFEVNLYASDPKIAKPIQMNFDADGRLWLATSEVYPHIKPGQQADDKILILDDTDRDGVADKTTVFADGLLIPTGVLPGDKGAYVVNSTELLHFRDTDGDGKADRSTVVLSGFGSEDTHHLLHTLRWGPDGALYMNQSIYIHSHLETPYGVRRLNGGGIWRFRPDTLELDIVCEGFVNPWGNHFDDWGQQFATDGAYGEGINYVFPGAIYVTAPNAKRRLLGLNPGSPKHCGLEIVGGSHLPDSWQGNMITNDFRAHRVCRFVVSEDGSGYASRQEVEVIKSSHGSFRPIDVKLGPDGAIYIADWYNPIIQHGEVDFRDSRRDHVHGRIWRVSAKNRPPVERILITGQPIEKLLDLLRSPEPWQRQFAKLELKQREPVQVVAALGQWLEQLDRDDPQYGHNRLEALWLYECVNQTNLPLLRQLLGSADHRVRAAAMKIAGDWHLSFPDRLEWYQRAVRDEHPRVRLEAVRNLAREDTVEAAVWAHRVLDAPMDRFLDFALWRTARDLQSSWLSALQSGQPTFQDSAHLIFALKAVESPNVVPPLLKLLTETEDVKSRGEMVGIVANLASVEQMTALLDWLADVAAGERAAYLEHVLTATAQSNRRPQASQHKRIVGWLSSDDARLVNVTVRAIGDWKITSAEPTLVGLLADSKASPELKNAAIRGLAALATDSALDKVTAIARGSDDAVQTSVALEALATPRPGLAASLLVANAAADSQSDATLRAILARRNGGKILNGALTEKSLPTEVAKRWIRLARQAAQPDDELIAALRTAGNLEASAWKFSKELSDQLVADVHRVGDPNRGETIYRLAGLQCQKCHAIAGVGGRVGPDMISLGASAQVDYLVESLLAPAAKVKENFHSLVIATDSGKIVIGIAVRRSERELVLRDAEDRLVTIPIDSIDEENEGRSLMPEGLIDELSRQDLVDLVRFLSELGKAEFAIGNQPVVRKWQALLATDQAHRRIKRTSFDQATKADEAFQWKLAASQVSGDLPTSDLPIFIDASFVVKEASMRTVFLRTFVNVSTAGKVSLHWNSANGILLWVDGQPTPIDTETLDLTKGGHQLTVAVDIVKRKDPIRLEIQPATGSQTVVQLNQ